MTHFLIRLSAALLFAGSTAAAMASPVITSFSGGSQFHSFYGETVQPSGDAVGFQFTADTDLIVTDLGILLDPADGVIDISQLVGLWRSSDQTLLGSASVDGTGTVLGGFVYASLVSDISLDAGQSYVLAALYAIDDDDTYLSGPTSITTNGISMTEAVLPQAGNLGLVYPALVSAGNLGRIGPNMIASDASVVPVPAAAWLFGSALLGLGLAGRDRSRRKA